MLGQLHAPELAVYSPVLPSGFGARLANAAAHLTEESLAEVAPAPGDGHRAPPL